MGSDGLNRILTGLNLFNPVRVRLVPLKTHDFHFQPDFDRILNRLSPDRNRIARTLVKNCLPGSDFTVLGTLLQSTRLCVV